MFKIDRYADINVFVFSILMLVGVTAFAKDSEKIVILNGVFFKELPSAAKNTPMLQDMKLFTINTPMVPGCCAYSLRQLFFPKKL